MQVIGFAIAVQKSVIAKGLTVLRDPPPPAPLPRSVANNKARFFARALVVNGRVEVRTERASRVEVRTERASRVGVRTERASSGTRSWTPIERDVNSNAVGQRGGNKTRIRQS